MEHEGDSEVSAERDRLRATLGGGRGLGALAPCGHSAMRTARLIKTAGTEAAHFAARVNAGVFTLDAIRLDIAIDPQLEAQLTRFADRARHAKPCCDARNYRQRDPHEPTAPRCAEQVDQAVSVRALVFRRLVSAMFELMVDRPELIESLKRGGTDAEEHA